MNNTEQQTPSRKSLIISNALIELETLKMSSGNVPKHGIMTNEYLIMLSNKKMIN